MLLAAAVAVPLSDFYNGKSWKEIFGFEGPLKVELCSGKDEFLIRMAEKEPRTGFVGIERSRAIAGKLISKIERSGLANIRVVAEPAEYVLQDCFSPGEVQIFFINFPDPWPKKRHFKRRLISPAFTALMADRLAPRGEIQFVSDHLDYVKWSLNLFEKNPALENVFGPGGLRDRLEDYPTTLYMMKYRREGRPFYFLKFRKK